MRWIFAFLLAGLAGISHTQTTDHGNIPDDSSLLSAFRKGKFEGGFRSFFMATDNAPDLSDYYALAAGGSLNFNSGAWHGFSLGIGGVYHYNLASSDLSAKDPLTGAVNRYEIGLFDVQNPQNKKDLDRLENLWLRYKGKHWQLTLGKQFLQTPFINPQDGRMRPTAEEGVWGEYNHAGYKLEGGWLWKISPRSTVQWVSIGESIGMYPKGLNPDGTGSGYAENLKSKGVGLIGLTRQWGKKLSLQAWDQYVDNIFNSAFVKADYTLPLQQEHQLLFGLLAIHQDAIDHGGNPDVAKTYFQPNSQSNAFSAQAGWQKGNWQALAAYTHITGDGRFLSPREWGREPFYTFMARERVEGSGNSNSVTARVNWQDNSKRLRLEAAYGRFFLPDVKEVALNKYAFPSFQQFNFDAKYAFGGWLKGLKIQGLYVWKGRLGEVYGNRKLVINKVNMSNYNLILNYSF